MWAGASWIPARSPGTCAQEAAACRPDSMLQSRAQPLDFPGYTSAFWHCKERKTQEAEERGGSQSETGTTKSVLRYIFSCKLLTSLHQQRQCSKQHFLLILRFPQHHSPLCSFLDTRDDSVTWRGVQRSFPLCKLEGNPEATLAEITIYPKVQPLATRLRLVFPELVGSLNCQKNSDFSLFFVSRPHPPCKQSVPSPLLALPLLSCLNPPASFTQVPFPCNYPHCHS